MNGISSVKPAVSLDMRGNEVIVRMDDERIQAIINRVMSEIGTSADIAEPVSPLPGRTGRYEMPAAEPPSGDLGQFATLE